MSLRRMLHSKIHRATVTHADVAYEGSICIASDLLTAARIFPGEAVWVWNVNNGQRFETYTIAGSSGSPHIGVFGAAARLVEPSHIVIIAAFKFLPEETAEGHTPLAVFVDARNHVKAVREEAPALLL